MMLDCWHCKEVLEHDDRTVQVKTGWAIRNRNSDYPDDLAEQFELANGTIKHYHLECFNEMLES